jgi:hypothetical protein
VTGFSFAAGVLNGVAAFAGGAKLTKDSVAGGGAESPLAPYVEAAFKQEDDVLKKLITAPVPIPPDVLPPGVDGLLSMVEGLKYGAEASQAVFLRMLPADPDVFTFLSSDIIPGPAAIAPGNSAAVNLNLKQDAFFTQPYSGGDVPTVFIANIQNAGPVTDTFSLSLGPVPGYQLTASVPSIVVPPGQTGQIGICAVPTGNTAPPATLAAAVISTSNSSIVSANTAGVSGGSSQVGAPNVVGMTQAAAVTVITGVGLAAGTVTQQASATVAAGHVISESPLAGTLVNFGAAVNLVVAAAAPLAVSGPASLPIGLVGVAYTATVTAAGGTGTYSWSASGLPQGLSMNANTGVISGTPGSNTGSPFSAIVTVNDGNTTANNTFSLTVSILSKCDINQDGSTTVADVQREIDEALGVAPAVHDLNQDGVVNIVDVQIVINAALGLGCSAK